MGGRLQISFGDLAELLRPALFVLAALASAWVLHDARRRFVAYAAAAWALLALLFPAVILPLYLAARLFTKRRDTEEPSTTLTTDETDDVAEETTAATDDMTDGEAEASPSTLARAQAFAVAALKRWALPLVYLAAVLAVGALYFYFDYTSFDAHYARARRANLYNQREQTVRELRAALGVREDAHTRKLLGMELAEAGRWEEALTELRAAARGGEPDDRLAYREGFALEKLNRPAEAAGAYQRFLQTQSCLHPNPDPLCDDARSRFKGFGF